MAFLSLSEIVVSVHPVLQAFSTNQYQSKMSCYFVARIRITDHDEYNKYLEKAGSIFRKHKGRYIVLDDEPEVLEGVWNDTRMVIIEFASSDDFYEWYNSAEYQDILKHRLNASECNTVLAKGLI